MKTVTVKNYTTSDGKTFKELAPAQRHELITFFSKNLKEDERLTSQSIIDLILANPTATVDKVLEVTSAGESEPVGEAA